MNDINKITTGITSKSDNNLTHQQITRVKSSIEYHIYHDGIIKYKLIDETGNGTDKTEYSLKNARSKAKYIYHDSSNNPYEIGTYDIVVTKDTYADDRYKDKLGGDMIYLINISDNISSYLNGNVRFTLSINTVRPYASDIATASLLGAMLNTGYTDFNYNGGSDSCGVSPAPSSSHKNGMNLDMRYLRKDESGNGIHLNLNSESGDPCGWKGLDVERQNRFIEELNRFGWGSILGWKYWDSNNSPNTSATWNEWSAAWKTEHPNETESPILKNIKHAANHQHHIHLQGYNPTLELLTD
ncbi:hypothetical protein [Phytobacter ursingii]|uniref:Uncharacterized protein n=1 Tax=Phytobacter ursingii TaxID=1972431 RepID=A0AB35RU85_9ENTR|nr:hypothetical protein [Phytobacter ursingii]MDV2865161.1 hypothetical protein [Phytobacter ursingii]